MELNLFSLKVLSVVAEKKSFSGAAKALLLTQPAISSQIRKLENYFRMQLVIRTNSGTIKLTEAGKIVCCYADKFTALREELLRTIEKQTGKSLVRLRMGACFIAGEHLLPGAVKTFRDKHPDVYVSLRVTKCEEIVDGLLSGSLDVGVVGLSPKSKFLIKKKLFQVPLTIFEAGDGQGEYQGAASIQELVGAPLIMREEGAGTRKAFQEFLDKHHVKLKQFQLITVSESNEAIKKLVMTGMGFSILPHFVVEEELKKGDLREICLEDGRVNQPFFLIYRKQVAIEGPQQQFIEFMLSNPQVV